MEQIRIRDLIRDKHPGSATLVFECFDWQLSTCSASAARMAIILPSLLVFFFV